MLYANRVACFLAALLLWAQTSVAETDLSNYWSYSEFLDNAPAQREISQSFSERVRAMADVTGGVITKPVKIAVVYPGIQASDYWRRSVSSFEARLREQKTPYVIYPYFTKPAREIRLQEKMIAEALKEDPDYLIFTLDALRHENTIQKLVKQGRPKVIIQNSTRPIKKWQDQPFLYVGFDHAVGSEMLAEKFMKTFGKGTDYALFYGSRGLVSAARGDTFMNRVDAMHGSKVTASYYLDFDRERSRKAALHLIKRNKMPKFIYACSTDIALGVIDAAKEMNMLDKISVNGWGGGGDELEALSVGELDFTVMRMNDDNGVAMAEAIYLDQTGRRGEVPQIYSGDIVLVDKSNTKAEIEALRKRAFRYSSQWQSSVDDVLRSDESDQKS
ncbi:substrate-binding domain-containing protein [Terasakiella sp. A23]|uniref:substrate-binding domain-containing protein n=1 Tax=Terasakiella sp. FCG-A23 TaxID=3080561 RepID=UPI002953D937|nr:substrate-binding domain-containing protein [Terasakiella sp. A23]MDV7339213.1 substrate-binding domain-containing protein [Terasakiella sp. A23]